MKSLKMVAAIGLAGLLAASVEAYQKIPSLTEESPLGAFYVEIAGYLDLRHDIEQYARPPQLSEDAQEFELASLEFAQAIQSARETAASGEIFTLDTAAILRTILKREMKEAQLTTSDLLADMPASEGCVAAVNQLFPWNSGTRLPPVLLGALPLLPSALEFRLVGTTLVLVDVDADLILDILPNALPDLDPIPVWQV
jgi:hypothetical protein